MGPRLLLPKRFPLGSAQRKPLTPYQHRQPKPWRLIEPLHERAIVIPWLSTAAVWDELKYSLRSIHRYFTDKECPIYIIGNAAPSWLAEGRVRFIEIPQYQESNEAGMWEAWQRGAQIAKEVMWTNDDIYFLRETCWDDLKTALSCGSIDTSADELRGSINQWRESLGNAVEMLHENGFRSIQNFATHTPYLFEIDKTREIFNTYHLPFKGAFETLYFNHHRVPFAHVDSFKTTSLSTAHDARYLNHRHNGPDDASRMKLVEMFQEPAPWERIFPRSLASVSSEPAPRIISMASFPPRSEGLLRVVTDLLPQCDAMRLYLNGYDSIPSWLPSEPKLSIVLAGPNAEHADLGSHGKWYWLGQDDCYHLTVDDDIFYAPGYVDHLVDACKRHNDKAVVGLHGITFKGQHVRNGAIRHFMRVTQIRHMLPYHRVTTDDAFVHILGSGVMCSRPTAIGLSREALCGGIHTGDDEDLAIWAQIHHIPMVRVASPVAMAQPNHTEWRKDPLHARPDFQKASDAKLKAYTKWTIHKP